MKWRNTKECENVTSSKSNLLQHDNSKRSLITAKLDQKKKLMEINSRRVIKKDERKNEKDDHEEEEEIEVAI